MAKDKKGTIIEVDILKSGINTDNPIDKLRGEDGYIMITRTKAAKEARRDITIERLAEKEAELKKLKEEASKEYSKEDIKKYSKKANKKKKKKEKKAKKKNKDTYMDSLMNSVPTDLAEYIRNGGEKGEKKKKKQEKKKKKLRDKLGVKVKEKKPNKKSKDKEDSKGKKKKNDEVSEDIAKRFKEVERISHDNIKTIDETMGTVDKRIKELTHSSDRMRGKDTAISNYLIAKGSLISTRQKIATDIMSARAKVIDIEMKKEKNAQSAANTDADILARIFPGIAMSGNAGASIAEHISKSGKNKDSKKKKKKKDKGYDIDPGDANILMSRMKKLEKSGEIELSDWNKNIEYEDTFNVAVKKSWETGDWKFIAVDDDNNILRDIPKAMLPSKKRVNMMFDDEKDVAVDKNSNTTYPVFAVPRL